MRSTDFGSKGMYKPTTTFGGKCSLRDWVERAEAHADNWKTSQESLKFEQTANLRLAGTTFDSKHMSNFMQKCPYVSNMSPTRLSLPGATQAKKEQDKIRSSYCFTSIDRYSNGQMKVYFD